MRLIDADHLRRWILSMVFKTQLSVADVIDQIDREDTIEPERKNGIWIKTGQSFVFPEKFRNYSCSECGYDVDKTKFNYCPNCGARMEESEE